MRVMLVDDDADDLALMQDVIHQIDPTIYCEVAGDGEEAIQFLESGRTPDLILLDINMPRMDGRACLQAIRANPRLARISVVILTTSILVQDELLCSSLDALYVEKPGAYESYYPLLKKCIAACKGQ